MLHIFLNKGIKDDIYYWSELNKIDQPVLSAEEDLSGAGFDQYRRWFPDQAFVGLRV
jgi:hypothetical protein